MTYQGDPNRRPGMRNPMQRDDGTWNVLPILLGVLFVIIVGFMLWPDRNAGPRSATTGIDRPTTTTPGTPGGPTKTTPSQPQ